MGRGICSALRPLVQGYAFTAQVDGTYAFCLDNKMSRWTAKVVDFDLTVKGECKSLVRSAAMMISNMS